jgi:hypothetical protein
MARLIRFRMSSLIGQLFFKSCSGFAMPENPVRALTGAN